MNFKIPVTISFICNILCGYAQPDSQKVGLDTTLEKKLTVAGFCLCRTSLADLYKLSNDFKVVEVEEMDLPEKCFGQDRRFENGKGYYSEKYPGIILQKDQNTDHIGKIRLTKEFKGNLPDGTPVSMQDLLLGDVFRMYPKLTDKWGSRGCSDYWKITDDTISFFVRIDSTKKPQFPVDEEYYAKKPVEAIDLAISCYSVFKRTDNFNKKPFPDPVIYIDSIRVTMVELQKYKPGEIAVVTVYKDTNALKLIGPEGKNGVIYIETKKFARQKYWSFFKGKSADYLKAVPNPQSDSSVVYILNDKVLKANFISELSNIDNSTFKDLKVINKERLGKDYGITDKAYGVLIKTAVEDKTKTR